MSKSWQGGAWWASEVKSYDAGLSGAQRCKQLRLGGRRAEPVEICTPDPAVLCAVSAPCSLHLVVCALHPPGLCAVQLALRCASWTVCNTVCRAEVCKPDPAPSQGCIVLLHPHSTASVLHVWQSCNLATVQCTMVAHRSPSVEIIFKLESSSLLCEPVALYAENILP